MASTCDVYKGGIKLGSGTCSDGSVSITSYTANDSGGLAGDIARVASRRNVAVVITQAGTHVGRSWRTNMLVQGATCTLRDACPFVGA